MPLQTVAEVDVNDPTSPTQINPPKTSPKPKLFTLKRDTRSRSNSSGLNVRRFSTDSIFGERLDTIGRRLSRDVTYSPADLGRKFQTFGKENFKNKSEENIVDHYAVPNKFDTLPTVRTSSRELLSDRMINTPAIIIKSPRRSPARSPVPERIEERNDETESPVHQLSSPKPKIPPRKRSPIPNYPIDGSKIALQNKLHEELKEKYGKKNFTHTSSASGNSGNIQKQ